jgi:hypothetical protein
VGLKSPAMSEAQRCRTRLLPATLLSSLTSAWHAIDMRRAVIRIKLKR